MRSYFKVWVQVEQITEHLDGETEYVDIHLPDPLGEFQTLTEAAQFVRKLPGWGACAATSDLREEVIRSAHSPAGQVQQ